MREKVRKKNDKERYEWVRPVLYHFLVRSGIIYRFNSSEIFTLRTCECLNMSPPQALVVRANEVKEKCSAVQ